MAEKLRLVLKNPILPLVLKAILLALAVFWLRTGDFGFFKTLVFLITFLAIYFRPKTNSGKFFVSSIVWLVLVFLAPNIGGLIGFYINLILSVLAFVLLGVKNVIFIRRQGAYYLLHLVSVVGATSLYFLGSISQIPLFIILVFLFREFYLITLGEEKPELINLIAAVEGLLMMEAVWVTSFFPTSFLVSASFLVLIAFIFHDVFVNYFKGSFTKQLALRDIGLFVFLAILIFSMPVWGFQ